MKILKNVFFRNIALIVGAILLIMTYEYQVQNYIREVTNPIVLIRTFHTLLFASFFWTFYRTNKIIYKLIELMATLIIFNLAVFFASPLHHAVVEMVLELTQIPELVNYLGHDFMSLLNNRYFGYSSCFLACLGVLRLTMFNLINSILVQTLMYSTEYVYTCKTCNGIVNKSIPK